MAKETQSVGLSMTMLCMTLCFIYVVFFGVHGESIQSELAAIQRQEGVYALAASVNGLQQQIHESTSNTTTQQVANIDVPEVTVPDVQEFSTTSTRPIAQAPTNTAGRTFFSVQELFREEQVNTSGIYELAGTRQWEGRLKSLVAVGLFGFEAYILKNIENTHFILLESLPVDFRARIEAKGGSVVEIVDKNTIKELQLFGDRVWYINLPSYEGIKVLKLVFIDDTIWYMQVDHEIYESRKQQFIDVFDDRFVW